MLSTRDYFRCKDKNKLKLKGWEKIFHANNKQNRSGIAIQISHKIDFKAKTL